MNENLKLNILKSNFDLRANLKTKELLIQKKWDRDDLINLINLNKKKKFIFHSGPPYANGNIHIGHALNIILKDFWLRFQTFNGYQSVYLPGWDTHGLPIALEIIKRNQKEIQNDENFRQKCRYFAKKQIEIQKKQFKRLGLLIDFSKKYTTFDRHFVSQQLRIFQKMVHQNLIFTSWKPIFWSWSSKTALADTEVIYLSKKSQTIFIKFPIIEEKNDRFKNTFFLVWTTTPWTIPENRFLAVNQKFKYLILQKNDQKMIFNQKLWKKISNNNQEWKIIEKIDGKKLCDLKYQHPYLDYCSKVLHSDHVNEDEGTGIVHIAPSFGLEDFNLTKKFYQIKNPPLDENGFFNQYCSDQNLINVFYQDSEEKIIQKIQAKNHLFDRQQITHSYPHDWRTKKPVIYRTTKQWYLNLKPLHQKIFAAIQKIKWNPKWGQKRLKLIIEKREDWCLSRQRKWGVPIPIFYDQQKKPILQEQLIAHVASLIEIHGDDIWWKWNLDQLLTPQQIKKYNIDSRCLDTFDVWFDSGCSAQINYQNQKIDVICEGTDQFRGWFNSLLIINTICDNHNIKKILTHGFVNDDKGKKMSKSLGNVVDPLQICNKYGADVLRLWVASSNFHEDLNLSDNLIQETSKNYVKIRNTLRFLINNLVDFEQEKSNSFPIIDQCILKKCDLFFTKAKINYQNGSFHLLYFDLINFINNDLSNNYFAYCKNILYIEPKNNVRRRQIQNVFYIILQKLFLVLAPIIPHTIEEGYQKANLINKKKSVHLLTFDEFKENYQNYTFSTLTLLKCWKMLLKLKDDCNYLKQKDKQKEKEKGIKLQIVFNKNYKLFKNENEYQKYLKNFHLSEKDELQKEQKLQKMIQKIDNLNLFLQIYEIDFKKEQKFEDWSKLAEYQKNYLSIKKCQRCWFKEGIENQKYCHRCLKIIIKN